MKAQGLSWFGDISRMNTWKEKKKEQMYRWNQTGDQKEDQK